MTTQVMSARLDADKLKYANQLEQREYGMSFAKSCKKAQSWAKKEGFDVNDVATFIKAARP